MKLSLYTIAFMLLLFACEERYDMDLPTEETNLLAVEAVLTNENINQKITLTLPYQSLNGSPAPATAALVRVQEGTGVTYLFSESTTQPGVYFSDSFQAVSNTTYTLTITYLGREIRAQDIATPVEPLEELKYQKVNDQYELILDESGQSPYYIDHSITWKNTTACTNTACEGRIVFYDLKNIDVNEIYKPAKKQFTFPGGSTVIRRKYSVSAAYRTFLRSVLSETEWRGGVFDVDRANATTNLSAGAVGFFAVTSVVTDTTVVNP